MTKRSHNDSLDGDHMDGSLNTMKRPVYYRQNSVISRFESLRRQYSENNYYDPYQQEQVQQQGKRKTMADDDNDDDNSSSQHQDPEGRPTKRRKSFTSMVKSGVIQSVLFGSALALTAFDYLQATTPSLKRSTSLCSMEALAASSHITTSSMDDTNNKWSAGRSSNHFNTNKQKKSMRGHGVDFSSYFYRSPTFEKRMQKTEQLIRGICLDQQYAFNQHFAPSTTGTRDDLCWGIVNKDDYDVSFTTMPPPKPKRTFSYLQKQKNMLFSDTA
ncbi:hypothetical protein BCR42DRAFT_405207 [Absidia repens]|uniref:Uncharacterized protein n=1 Tax=Absidia repens TaxID=90262 RepID=A0A1X2IX67_9FUNG|nr:hypothetical protein BCR42DRAFT_405207 [Absidia repens]